MTVPGLRAEGWVIHLVIATKLSSFLMQPTGVLNDYPLQTMEVRAHQQTQPEQPSMGPCLPASHLCHLSNCPG